MHQASEVFCPTRWTVTADSLKSVIDNYAALEGTCEEAADATKDTETKARIHGVSVLMKTLDYLFGNMLGEMILRHTDNLSSTLQNKHLSASEGQQIAQMTLDTLQTLRTDLHFDLFWTKVSNMADTHSIPEAQLP